MIAVIDYDAGNIKSVEKALIHLGADVSVTRNRDEIQRADKVILPGVGAFGDAMDKLESYGLDTVIREAVDKGKPFLGICLGLQLIFERSDEAPGVKGLSLLKGEILKIFETEKCDKVNIIAHSKGGLDSKYMIQNLGMEDGVASLTTLCTPHKGSPLASNILRAPKWILKIIAFFINFWYRIFGDKHPDSLAVCKQLAQSNDIEKETFLFSDKVYCQSYSSKMEKAKDDFVMGIPLMFSHYYEKGVDSDGAVSKESAVFGEYKGDAFDQSVSHTEITDFLTKKKKKET